MTMTIETKSDLSAAYKVVRQYDELIAELVATERLVYRLIGRNDITVAIEKMNDRRYRFTKAISAFLEGNANEAKWDIPPDFDAFIDDRRERRFQQDKARQEAADMRRRVTPDEAAGLMAFVEEVAKEEPPSPPIRYPGASDDGGDWVVVFTGYERKIQAIKAIRRLCPDLGIKAAKDFVEEVVEFEFPHAVTGMSKHDADELAAIIGPKARIGGPKLLHTMGVRVDDPRHCHASSPEKAANAV